MEINASVLDALPSSCPRQQQEGAARSGSGDEMITVDDDVSVDGSTSGTSTPTLVPATKTAADGTLRTRLAPRKQQQTAAPSSARAPCCNVGSSATVDGSCSVVGAFSVDGRGGKSAARRGTVLATGCGQTALRLPRTTEDDSHPPRAVQQSVL